jgi:hypothetical protein
MTCSGFRVRQHIPAPKTEKIIVGASDASFATCNGCEYVFKRRGLVIDERDFQKHKAHCIARLVLPKTDH